MSTSSAIRLLLSTWVALTTMQHKTQNHTSTFLLQQNNKRHEGVKRRATFKFSWKQDLKTNTSPTSDKFSNNSSLTAAKLTSAFPAGRGDYPCVIHILTSVFQCEGRINTCVLWSAISSMNPWNTKGFWTGATVFCVCKIQKDLREKHKKTQRAWIFAAP